MEVSVTFFKSIYDNTTHKRMTFEDFSKFEKFLYDLSKRPLKNKKDAQLLSPALFVDDNSAMHHPDALKEPSKKIVTPYYHRKNVNVVSWDGWAAVDVDDHIFEGNLEDELFNKLGNYNYVCYSTASSSVGHPKFRLVFPLTKSLKNTSIKAFWYALNSEIGSIGDKQTKDLSRMFYIPALYDGSHNFIFSNKSGSVMDPDIIIAKYPFVDKAIRGSFVDRLPRDIQQNIIKHKKSNMNNTDYTWTGYRDCPFFPNKMADEYAGITGTGWYLKLYQIMVAIASQAVKKEYPISTDQIVDLCRELDMENGNWYETRPLKVEADRAIEYAYKNN